MILKYLPHDLSQIFKRNLWHPFIYLLSLFWGYISFYAFSILTELFDQFTENLMQARSKVQNDWFCFFFALLVQKLVLFGFKLVLWWRGLFFLIDLDLSTWNMDFRERVKLRVRLKKCRDESYSAQIIIIKLISANWAFPWEWLILLTLKVAFKVERLPVITVLPNYRCDYFGHSYRIPNLEHLFFLTPELLHQLWNVRHFPPFLPSYQDHDQLSLYWLYWLYHNSPTASNLPFLPCPHQS